MQKAVKANLLDHFYEHLDETDWLEGVDLYQAGRIGELSVFGGLVTGQVHDGPRMPYEVRLKIHPSGHCIQWIECTCRKNRTQGIYCEHIAGFMVHVDRERPELFASLDTAMPLKPPAGGRRGRTKVASVKKADDKRAGGSGAAEKILEHKRDSIQGVSLIAHGPTIRVRIEIKPGHLTHYDLSLDKAAKFLVDHPELPSPTAEVKNLDVFDDEVELGTRIYQIDEEKIVAERVVAVKLKRKPTPKQQESMRFKYELGKYTRVAIDDEDGTTSQFQFIPLKTASKYLGEEFYFMPGRGYFPLNRGATNASWYDLPLTKTFKDDDAAVFARDRFAEYVESGPVFLDEQLRDPVIMDAPKLAKIKIVEQGDGWFQLDPRYGDGKGSISMADLMKQYRKKRRKYVRTGGAWLKIPDFVTEHEWELDADGETIKVDALGLLRLKAAVGDFDQFVGSKTALNQIRDKLTFSNDVDPPSIEHTGLDLRQYQENGLAWMWWLYCNNLHGLLADEMGLGKTHQAMGLMSAIQTQKKDARFLVICPTTVLDHWTDKIEQFASNLRPVKYHGAKRGFALRSVGKSANTIVTSYGVMLRDVRQLTEEDWDAIILDEAHFVKNNDTATYRAVCRLRGRIRICLTGTPMENHLGELKNIFDFLVPGFLGSDEYFRKHFVLPIERQEMPETEMALQKLIHPFKMRRTKGQVLPDLPAKVEDLRHCGLSPEQVRMYREILSMKAKPLVEKLQDEEAPIPYLHVFATLTMLKQLCDHPALLAEKPDYKKHESGKFDLLQELLAEALGSDHKVVIYSQYVGMVKLISQYLSDENIGHVTLTGQSRNRGDIINKFQTDPNIKVFVGSLLAGGIGIDLTAASVVIHYDRWWNASKENQATDRVHRIGQNKNVLVLKLCSRGTLEEKIDRMIQSKQALFEKFLDRDEEIFKTLSRQELIELLQ